jgi:HAE1 family hydrophobic/amphiphilic exporter-1
VEVNGTEILLQEVADIRLGQSPREILHNNQNRIVEITADLDRDHPLDRIATTIHERLKSVSLPPEYSYRISGQEAMRKESVGNLGFALLLSLILVYMVMAAQFESLVHPFTILLTVPLAVVGAVAIFFFQGKPMNIMAIIGIILLVGIAVNNSIILVDAINQFRREGLGLREAIIAAGQRRIRPIIMTSLTTILALFPLTLGFGESAALRSPMAWAVIGGLVTSTLLTLIVIPCIYMLFGQIGVRRVHRKKEAGE